ncbi:MAG: beta strand repeat-containing protein, partial [Planctomycetaceae bacterium]
MAISALMKLVRRYFQDTTAAAEGRAVKRPRVRRPMLVQLEERRVFNATFLLNAGGLTLSNFDANSNLNISQNGGNLELQLSGAASNNWAPSLGSNPLSTSGGGSIITVSRGDFTGSVNFTITDAPAGNLDVIIADAVTLPTATTGSTFAMTIGGQLDIAMDTGGSSNDAFDATGYSLQFAATGEILLHDDIRDSAGDDATSVNLNSADDVTLSGQISAENSVTITSGGSIVDGNADTENVIAPTVTLQAASGIGDSDAIEIQADSLSATNSTSGRIRITELSAGGSLALNAINNATRDVFLTVQNGALTDGNDGTTPETLNITAGNLTLSSTTGIGSGDALETQITSLTASTSGNIQLTELAAGGDLALRTINAGSGLVDLRALGGALTDDNAAADNILAGSVRLAADTGIGAADAIETTGAGLLLAAQTRTGNLQIVNTGALLVGTVGGLVGAQITSNTAASNLVLRARSPLTINTAVSNVSGGDIILAAEGTATADNLAINAAVSASGGNGSISLYAGNNITMGASGSITAAGSGAILLRASTNYAGGTATNGYNSPLAEASSNGIVSMNTSASITSATGDITIRGDGDVSISTITSASGNITISADDDGVTTMSDGGGAIIDALTGEAAANITSGGTSLLTLSSGSGIGV